jgi:WD40 repeat protein
VPVLKPLGPPEEPLSPRYLKTLVHPDRRAVMSAIRFTADGTQLFTSDYTSGIMQVFNPATGRELRQIVFPVGCRTRANLALENSDLQKLYVPVFKAKRVAFEKDGQKRVHVEASGEIRIWDLVSGEALPPLKSSAPRRGVLSASPLPAGDKLVAVEELSYSPDKEQLFQKERRAWETVLWDLKTRSAKPLARGFGSAAFTRDGRRLAIALSTVLGSGRLMVFDVATGKELFATHALPGRSFSDPVFSHDGKLLAIRELSGGVSKPATIRLYDTRTGKDLAAFETAGPYPFDIPSFSSGGQWLAVTDWSPRVTIWDMATRKMAQTTPLNGMRLNRLAFSPDGKRLAVPAQAKLSPAERDADPAELPQPRIYLFDLVRAGDPEVIVCPHGFCGVVAFSPDGKTLAFGGSGGVHLFDVPVARFTTP